MEEIAALKRLDEVSKNTVQVLRTEKHDLRNAKAESEKGSNDEIVKLEKDKREMEEKLNVYKLFDEARERLARPRLLVVLAPPSHSSFQLFFSSPWCGWATAIPSSITLSLGDRYPIVYNI